MRLSKRALRPSVVSNPVIIVDCEAISPELRRKNAKCHNPRERPAPAPATPVTRCNEPQEQSEKDEPKIDNCEESEENGRSHRRAKKHGPARRPETSSGKRNRKRYPVSTRRHPIQPEVDCGACPAGPRKVERGQ